MTLNDETSRNSFVQHFRGWKTENEPETFTKSPQTVLNLFYLVQREHLEQPDLNPTEKVGLKLSPWIHLCCIQIFCFNDVAVILFSLLNTLLHCPCWHFLFCHLSFLLCWSHRLWLVSWCHSTCFTWMPTYPESENLGWLNIIVGVSLTKSP